MATQYHLIHSELNMFNSTRHAIQTWPPTTTIPQCFAAYNNYRYARRAYRWTLQNPFSSDEYESVTGHLLTLQLVFVSWDLTYMLPTSWRFPLLSDLFFRAKRLILYIFVLFVVIDSCMDKNGNCPAWKQSGACQSSPDIMKEHCKHSCNFCNGEWIILPWSGLLIIIIACIDRRILKSSSSNRRRSKKFLIDFWHLLDNFLMASPCIWPIKMQGLWEAELTIVAKPTGRLTTPPPTVLTFWLASKETARKSFRKIIQRCQKLIKQNFVEWTQLDCNKTHGMFT